jgi:hypothetical protein
MASFRGAVYDPPSEGFPTLTVVFGANGDVLIARCMENRQQAEALLAQIGNRMQEMVDQVTDGSAAA